MATLSQAISTNKLRADFWINSLIKLSNDEKKRFFSSSRLISKYDYEIRQFHELIRASDRLSLTYSTIGSIMSDINAVGGTIAKSIHNNQSLISYGLDNRFSILYQLLEKRIQKREEFLLCINSYNDIVLGFLELKREDNYKNLSLETISEIDHQVETPKLSSSSPTYKSKNFLAPSNNKFTFKNETHLIVQFSLHYKVNDKRQVEIIDTIHPNETKIINGPRQFYEVLVSENVNKGEKISAILKTVKAGYGYKIVVHNRDKKFLLISL